MGGSSLVEAARVLVDDAREMAATRFGVSADDVTFEDGVFRAPADDGDGGSVTEQTVDIQTLARDAYLGRNLPGTRGAGLEASAAFDPMGFTFPFGAHVAVVEVDGATGRVDVRRYVAVDDCGPRLNPRIVEGQVHGGVAQGIGQALYEAAAYDDDGRLRAGRLDEYAVPRASELPDIETGETVTPSPLNPLGVKGIGEGGTIAAPPAVVNAVVDALEPFDIDHLDMPLTPERVWAAMWGDGEPSAGDSSTDDRLPEDTSTESQDASDGSGVATGGDA
jgi:carbon-monoxide dehydrogenase large subunit